MIEFNDEFLEATADRDPEAALTVIGEYRSAHGEPTGLDGLIHIVTQVRVRDDDRRYFVHHTTEPTDPRNVAVIGRAWALAMNGDYPLTFRVWRTPEVGSEETGFLTVSPRDVLTTMTKAVEVVRPNPEDERRAAGFHPPVNNTKQ